MTVRIQDQQKTGPANNFTDGNERTGQKTQLRGDGSDEKSRRWRGTSIVGDAEKAAC